MVDGEHEAILQPGVYNVAPGLGGYVWEYSASCAYEVVKQQVVLHIQRRLGEEANKKGYGDSEQVASLFSPA